MKRLICIVFLFSILLGLTACGEKTVDEASSTSQENQSAAVEMVGDYVIPQQWNTASVNDGTWSYVTSEVTIPVEGDVSLEDGQLLVTDTEDSSVSYVHLSLVGEELDRITVPIVPAGENESRYYSFHAFGDEGLWVIEDTYVVIDEETGEMAGSYQLKKFNLAGEECCTIALDEAYLGTEDGFIVNLFLTPEGNPVLQNMNSYIFCDGTGAIVKTTEVNPEVSLVTDGSGRTYLWDSIENTVSTMDWDDGTAGDVVLTVERNETVLPCGYGYDLLLKSDSRLRGVSFTDGTITEILSWDDLNMAGMVGGVATLDDDTLFVSIYDMLMEKTQLLKLTRMPSGEIPEKSVVTMAVALHPNLAESGCTWTDVVDQIVATQIANFNRGNEKYRVEVVTFSSAEELQLQMLSGDAPDVICWDDGLDEMPSMEIYAKKGYLTDLTPLFEKDEELSLEDFIPSVLELATERTEGLYAMPTTFYLHSWLAPIEYVGESPDWTFASMLEVAESLPEDMAMFQYVTRGEFIQMMLQSAEGMFVDVTAGTCDFFNQEFYDLLTIARDYCAASVDDENYENNGKEILLEGVGVLGRLGQFASDTIRPAKESGKIFVGYPGDSGNGFAMIFRSDLSICATGNEPEGAWEFVRTFFQYDYQSTRYLPMCSVRKDAFEEREDWYLEVNGSCTREESLEARELVYGAKCLRNYTSPILSIVQEEAAAFFSGDKTAEAVASIIESRVKIYLSEQS